MDTVPRDILGLLFIWSLDAISDSWHPNILRSVCKQWRAVYDMIPNQRLYKSIESHTKYSNRIISRLIADMLYNDHEWGTFKILRVKTVDDIHLINEMVGHVFNANSCVIVSINIQPHESNICETRMFEIRFRSTAHVGRKAIENFSNWLSGIGVTVCVNFRRRHPDNILMTNRSGLERLLEFSITYGQRYMSRVFTIWRDDFNIPITLTTIDKKKWELRTLRKGSDIGNCGYFTVRQFVERMKDWNCTSAAVDLLCRVYNDMYCLF